MTNEEVRSRYSLSKWHGIVLFILMFLVAVGLATSLYVIVDFSLGNEIDYPVMSICSLLAFLFFAVYSIWGYKMRILSFQIIVFYIAACFLALGIDYYCRAGWGYGTECLVLAVFLIGFALTIKKPNGIPRALAGIALGIQLSGAIFELIYDFGHSPISWAVVTFNVQLFLAVFVINGIYYSRIARQAIPFEAAKEDAASDEKITH